MFRDAKEREYPTVPQDVGTLGEERCHGGIIFEGNEAKTCDSTRTNSRTGSIVLGRADSQPNPESSKTVRDFLLELKKEKKTIFLNTHNLDEAQRICDRIGILNTKLMAIGTPEELERSVKGRKTVIQLEQVNDAILNALRKLSIDKMTSDNSRLTIDVANPEKENPAIVRAIVEAGGDIQSVSVIGSTLEDAYLKLVKETK